MADEAASQKRAKFFFVHSSDLDSVKLDDDEKVDDAETLLELLQAPIADPCLEALRRIMSMTYFESLDRTSELRVRDIRALAVKPLGELGKELEALKLPRVDADRSFEHDHSAKVFQYNIVPAKELRRRVNVEGSRRRQSLDEIFKHIPADPAIRTLREILSMTFRDLYYRLAAFTLKIPPLRNRTTDIPAIADHLLARINSDFAKAEPGYQDKRLSVSTKRFLCQQAWPGNVRQLHNVLLQAAVMIDGPTIEPRDIEAGLSDAAGRDHLYSADLPLGDGFSLTKHLEDVQRRFLARAMQEADGKKTVAAKLLGYPNYQTLAAQLERLNVDVPKVLPHRY